MSEPSNHSSSIEEALRQSEERYQLVALTISDAIWDWNLLTNTVQWSHGLRSLFGYQNHDDKLHTWWAEHVHPDDLAHIEESVNAAIVAHESYWSGEYRFCRSDGSYAHVLDRGHLVYDEHGRAVRFVGAMEDISERVRQQQALIEQEREYQKTLEQRVAERTHELTAILQSSRKIALTLELNVVLELILEQLHTVAPYDGASIMSLEEGEWLEGRAYRGPKPSGWIRQFRFSIDNPVDRKVIASRQPLIAEDLHGDNPIGRYFQADHGERFAAIYAGVRSWMRIPLIVRDEIVGMLTLHHREPGHFTERDAEIALAFADQAAVAIHNARLYAQAQQLASLQERQRLARELHDSVSQALALARLLPFPPRHRSSAQALRSIMCCNWRKPAWRKCGRRDLWLRPNRWRGWSLLGWVSAPCAVINRRCDGLCAEPDIPLKAKGRSSVSHRALHNVVKHANTRPCLQPEGNLLALSVTDDGRGFDPTVDFPGHLGLQSMRERVEMLGGHVAVESSSGAGARILVQLPVD